LWREAAAAVRRAIVSGALQRGDQVSAPQLARQLGISQAPTRDAIRSLVQEGLLEQRGGVTLVACGPDADIVQLSDFRLHLEIYALRLAAGRVDPQAEGELRERLARMEDAAAGDDGEAFVPADVAFHRALVRAARHHWVLAAWENLAPTVEAVVQEGARLPRDRRAIAARHRRLLELVLRGDSDAAVAELQRHLKVSWARRPKRYDAGHR
jgi:DNA-binding GntR family transcriptional regulator